MKPPENDPVQRLAVFTTTKKSSPALAAGIKRMRDAKHPVTEFDLGESARPLTDEELAQVVSLDRYTRPQLNQRQVAECAERSLPFAQQHGCPAAHPPI